MKRDKIHLDKLYIVLKVKASSIDDRSLFLSSTHQNIHNKKQCIQLRVILSHKRIHCCKSRFSSRGKCSWNNARSSTLVQWSNNGFIWTDIPLFTSPFFRESYCLYLFWNSSHKKKLHLGCKKTLGFVVYSVTHRMRLPPPPKKLLFVYMNSGTLSLQIIVVKVLPH